MTDPDATPPLTLSWLPGRLAVCRLDPGDPIPDWALDAEGLVSITRTDNELSIVAPESVVPADITAERNFAALRVNGVLDFSLVGVLASLTTSLAAAGVSTFAISTYDTDILLVEATDTKRAAAALRSIAALT